jgi:membrane protein DedA with SNARE-associated domain/uncharacterized membrane protein YccC
MNPTALVESAGLWSYVVVFALTAGETGAFIGVVLPGETLILLAAALAGRGDLDPILLAVAVVAGGITGDSIGFALGHWYEHRRGAERLRGRVRPGSRIGQARDFLLRHGGVAIFTGRFIGFVRSFLPFAAGAAGMRYRRFLLFSAAASLVWGVGNVLAGYFLGAAAGRLLRTAGLAGAGGAGVLTVMLLLLFRIRRRRTARASQAAGTGGGTHLKTPPQRLPAEVTHGHPHPARWPAPAPSRPGAVCPLPTTRPKGPSLTATSPRHAKGRASRPVVTSTSFQSDQRLVGPRRWWDWVLAFDPGLANLQASRRMLVSLVVGFATGYGMAHAVGIPTALGLTLGGIMGIVSATVVAENTPMRLARAMIWMPFPACAGLVGGVRLHPHRVLEMCLVVATTALFFYLPRYGTLGLVAGVSVFVFCLFGTMTPIPLYYCGRLALVVGTVAVAVLTARLALCPPTPRKDLLRTQRAFVVEARRVTSAAADVLSSHADRTHPLRRMRRALHRLNITTMIVDGRLAMPELAADPMMTELLHRYLFDAEISLQGIAKAGQDLASRPVPRPLREAMTNGLAAATDAHLARVHELRPWAELIRREAEACEQGGRSEAEVLMLARRIGDLLESLTDALACWLQLGWNAPASGGEVPYQPGVMLEAGGRPTGVAGAARRLAAVEHGKGWRGAISPYLHAPLQVTIGASITVPLADAVNAPHYYWGLIGVVLSLMGSTTTERVRKTVHRLGGTALGATIGIIVLHLTGHGHNLLVLTVIVGSVSVGVLGVQHFYFFFVTFLTFGLVQLYAMSTPDSGIDRLLAQRVIENGMGMVVGTLCAALLFPLTMRKVIYEAEHGYLNALEQLITKIAERWRTPGAQVRLRGAARAVDAALYQIRSTLRPVIRMPVVTRNKSSDHVLALLGTAGGHARTLAATADVDIRLGPWESGQVEQIIDTLIVSLNALDRRVTTGESGGTWTLVSPLIHALEPSAAGSAGPQADHLRVALDELAALDEVLAILAETRGLSVTTGRAHTAATAQQESVPWRE